MAHPYPPPPPLIPGVNQAQYHLAYAAHHGRNPAPITIPPAPNRPPPLTSATYIPEGETFGPGVGIPALFTNDANDIYGYPPGSDNSQHVQKQYNPETYAQPSQTDLVSHTFRDPHNPIPPGHQPATSQNPQNQIPVQPSDLPAADATHQHAAGDAANPTSEADERWPLDKVLIWLAHNGFSHEWQETFKSLDLKGADFIELGRRANGRGKMGKFHQVVYPQLSKECEKSGTPYNQNQEREAGKRLLKLVKALAESEDLESTAILPSASTDGNVENSPNLSRETLATLPSSATGEYSPGQLFAKPVNPSAAHRQFSAPLATSSTGPAGYDHSTNEAGHPDSNQRSDFSRSILSFVGERRRHSRSASRESNIPPIQSSSDNKSRAGSPVPQYSSLAPAESAPSGDAIFNKRYSSDSMVMSREPSSQGVLGSTTSNLRSATGGSSAEGLMGGRPNESRRFGSGAAPQGCDGNVKEHRGLLNMFRKKKGYDSIHHSPEENGLDSPTSPGGIRNGFQVFGKPGFNGSDMSLEPPMSTVSDHDRQHVYPRKAVPSPTTRRYLFATLDGWNYRLIDVTDVDAANTLRAVICNNVGIQDTSSAQIYLTEPGQMSHEEPLSDTMLVVNRRSKSDSQGTLKLFVHSIPTPTINVSGPQTAGLNITVGGKNPAAQQPSPYYPYTPGIAAAASTGENSPTVMTEAERQAALLAAHEEHQKEVERKKRLYLQRRDQIHRKDVAHTSPYGIKREGVIDFDFPRISPFEEKRNDNLIPMRKPPLAPSESSTLTKVNSLSKRPEDRAANSTEGKKQKDAGDDRFKPPFFQAKPPMSPKGGHSLGAALASVGKMSGAIGKPFTSRPVVDEPNTNQSPETPPANLSSPRLPSITPGDETFFTVPDFKNLNSSLDSASEDKGEPTESAPLTQPMPVSPASKHAPGSIPEPPAQKTSGPDFDFQENEVSFIKSPEPLQQDSDDDSDDGLFAKPLANRPNANQAKRKPVPQAGNLKPSLTVNTESKSDKRSVSFLTPGGDNFAGSSSQDSSADHSARPSADGDGNELSSDNPMHNRRDSIVRDDIWASRPPVEGMIDHLDDFFPNIDLDEPYLEGIPQSPPMSPGPTPVHNEPIPELPSLRDRAAQGTGPVGKLVSQDTPDTLGSDESTLKAAQVVAQKTVGRSGGLSRMKSIREVARGAHQVRRKQSAMATNTKAEPPLRRKSTKMFGARIMQISPKPGSRLSELDPLPQHYSAQGKGLQRQPTFRIIRGQLIGKGTYGRVYLGINADNGEIIAVKQVEVSPKAAGKDKDRIKEMVAAIDQEIDTMQHLEHPNIVQYLGCERGELSMSIYLEYIPGGSIGSCLRKHGKFEESVVKSLNRQVLSGLAYLHDQGILHRDLKADNILLDLDGTCKISDFGISKKTDNIYGNDVTNSMQGSVFWMAPEVVQSQGQGYSAKVDIWSLGCVVLEMFAGRRPWSTEEAIGAIFKLGSLNQAPPIPEDVSLSISLPALSFMYDCFQM